MSEDIPNLKILEGTSFYTLWEWRKKAKQLDTIKTLVSATRQGEYYLDAFLCEVEKVLGMELLPDSEFTTNPEKEEE